MRIELRVSLSIAVGGGIQAKFGPRAFRLWVVLDVFGVEFSILFLILLTVLHFVFSSHILHLHSMIFSFAGLHLIPKLF